MPTVPIYNSASAGLKIINVTKAAIEENSNLISQTELDIFNSMLKDDFELSDFAVSQSDIVDRSNAIAGKDVIVNSLDTRLGEIVAISSNYQEVAADSSVFSSESTILGNFNVSQSLEEFSQTTKIDSSSVPIYDMNLKLEFQDMMDGDNIQDNLKVSFDTQQENYNMFKMVNSKFFRRVTDINSDQFADSGLKIGFNSFNQENAFVSLNQLSRIVANNQLVAGDSINSVDPKLVLLNSTASNVIPDDTKYSITVNTTDSVNNENIYYGALKFEQPVESISITFTYDHNATLSILTTDDAHNVSVPSAVPSTMNYSTFRNLFSENDFSKVQKGYSFKIQGVVNVNDGYNLNYSSLSSWEINSGFFTADNSLLENNYVNMSKLSDSTYSHSLSIILPNDLFTYDTPAATSNTSFFTINSLHESLSQADHTSSIVLKAYFSNITNDANANLVNRCHPESVSDSGSENVVVGNIPSLSIYYENSELPGSPAGINTISNNVRNTYDVKVGLKCLVASTTEESTYTENNTNKYYFARGATTDLNRYYAGFDTLGTNDLEVRFRNAVLEPKATLPGLHADSVHLVHITNNYLFGYFGPSVSEGNTEYIYGWADARKEVSNLQIKLTDFDLNAITMADSRINMVLDNVSVLPAWTAIGSNNSIPVFRQFNANTTDVNLGDPKLRCSKTNNNMFVDNFYDFATPQTALNDSTNEIDLTHTLSINGSGVKLNGFVDCISTFDFTMNIHNTLLDDNSQIVNKDISSTGSKSVTPIMTIASTVFDQSTTTNVSNATLSGTNYLTLLKTYTGAPSLSNLTLRIRKTVSKYNVYAKADIGHFTDLVVGYDNSNQVYITQINLDILNNGVEIPTARYPNYGLKASILNLFSGTVNFRVTPSGTVPANYAIPLWNSNYYFGDNSKVVTFLKNQTETPLPTSISNKTILKPRHFYNFTGSLETQNAQISGWHAFASGNSTPNSFIVDPFFDSLTTSTLVSNNNNGSPKIELLIQLADATVLDYDCIIPLNNKPGTTSLSAKSYEYRGDALRNFDDENWSPINGPPTVPVNGTAPIVTDLYTNLVVVNNGRSAGLEWSELHVYSGPDNTGELFVLTFQNGSFVTNYVLLSSPTPLFKHYNTIGESSQQVGYKLAETSTKLKLLDGVVANFVSTIQKGNCRNFTLDADKVGVKLYDSYSSGDYVTAGRIQKDKQLVSGNGVSSSVSINAYRGIITPPSVGAAIYQTLSYSRHTMDAEFKVSFVKNNVTTTYKQYFTDVYKNKVLTVDHLVNETDNSDVLGSIGFKVKTNYSLFKRPVNEPTAQRVQVPIDLQFSNYRITVDNNNDQADYNGELELDRTVSASQYLLFNDYNHLKFYAGRVKAYTHDSYLFTADISDFIVYWNSNQNYLGDPSTYADSEWVFYANYTHRDMLAGVDINSSLRLKRFESFPGATLFYVLCPPPQYFIEAVKTSVSAVPYVVGQSNSTPVRKYIDVNSLYTESVHPFATTCHMNNLAFGFDSIPHFITLRQNISAFKDTVDFHIFSNKVKVSQVAGDNSLTVSLVDYNVSIEDLQDAILDDELDGELSSQYSNYAYKLKVTQKLSMIYGTSSFDIKNITINGVPIFGVSPITLALQTGNDATLLKIYGSNISYDEDGKHLLFTATKYECAYPVSLNSLVSPLEALKKITFNDINKVSTCSKVINTSYSDVGYSLVDKLHAMSFTSQDEWNETVLGCSINLNFNAVARKFAGAKVLYELIDVTKDTPVKFGIFDLPDIQKVLSNDGSPVFKVTYSGMVQSPVVLTNYSSTQSPVSLASDVDVTTKEIITNNTLLLSFP